MVITTFATFGNFKEVLSQERYPSKTFKIHVGANPEGSADFMLRPLINQLSTKLGQAIVLEHRPGANQTIAVVAVANSPPDGY